MHYKKLIERKKYFLESNFFQKQNLQFIESDDKEEIEWVNNETSANKQVENWQKLLPSIIPILMFNAGLSSSIEEINLISDKQQILDWMKPRRLKESEISLIFKHHTALLLAAASKDPTFILEDDALEKEDTIERIETIYMYFKKNKVSYLDIAGGCNLPRIDSEKANEIGICNLVKPRSRTTAGYLVAPNCAKIMAMNLFPNSLPLDWLYQYIFLNHNFKVSWCIPELFEHGSQNKYKSSIQK